MGISTRRRTGTVVIVEYPFSNLSRTKRRPAVVIAQTSRRDWLLCQITSNPYADSRAIELSGDSFDSGQLRHTSYARPGKLFTAERSLVTREAGVLKAEVFNQLIDSVIDLLNQGRRE